MLGLAVFVANIIGVAAWVRLLIYRGAAGWHHCCAAHKLNTEQIFMPMFRDEAARCAVEIVKTALVNGSAKLRGNGPTASDTPKGLGEKDGLYLASLISTLTDHLEKL